MTARLHAAYARSSYEAAGAVARIGQRSPAVAALLARRGAREGGFVTAWNPWSRRMPPGWNDRMLARLRQAARRLPMAEGWGGDRRWRERHLLLAGDPRRLAVLARRFRQAAIVTVRQGQPARLVPLARPQVPTPAVTPRRRRAGGPTAPAGAGCARSGRIPGAPG